MRSPGESNNNVHTCNEQFVSEGDEEKQARARRGQRAPRRPVRHPAAVVPDETHEEQAAPEGELSNDTIFIMF